MAVHDTATQRMLTTAERKMNGRLIPSTPIPYTTFHDGIQGTSSVNCRAADAGSKRRYKGTQTASVIAVVTSAIHRDSRSPHTKMTIAPSNGSTVATVRTG